MKIAIIGSGISGLGIAYILNKYHDITIYEKNNYIGGHSRTVDIKLDDKVIPVDTGFIVFNYSNYPNLSNLFKHLNVPIIKSNMSFGVSINNGWLEYGTRGLSNIFTQKINLLRPGFLKMLADVLKFNSKAINYIESDLSLNECLNELKLGKWFREYYLLAMGASIWSTPSKDMLDFPASSFIKFFKNHGLLKTSNQPQWYTVKGGSKEYIKLLVKHFKDKIKLKHEIYKVIRKPENIEITDNFGNVKKYDQVIFACHSDQIIRILDKPTLEEQNIISAIKYQPNEMILHSDINFMPKRKKSWSSWVYLSESKNHHNSINLSYWMNNLQPLNTNKPIIVTINPKHQPNSDKIYDKYTFYHPLFNKNSVNAQRNLDKIQGIDRIWYAGAWQRYGFHEDGLLSAVNIANKMGVKIPWK